MIASNIIFFEFNPTRYIDYISFGFLNDSKRKTLVVFELPGFFFIPFGGSDGI
jgi:hypothetical protein